MQFITIISFAVAAALVTAADPKTNPVGGACGGGTQNAPICETNLDCVPTSNAIGAQGICTIKSSDLGGPCQQLDFPNTSAVCKTGLVCDAPVVPTVFPPPKGIAGICKKATPVGGVCGGNATNTPLCDVNLDCVAPSVGSQGICTVKTSDVGGPCQQLDFPNTSAVCKTGLVCEAAVAPAVFPPPKGIAGKCKKADAPVTTATSAATYAATTTKVASTTKLLVSGASVQTGFFAAGIIVVGAFTL
ncbi:hypothetical protein HDU79_000272 [Rhizoclosmatium sp. JEL0117]|nr:hypothetical protein HDU79_000272 [Rhizoclosmatium sp. JEL0117]